MRLSTTFLVSGILCLSTRAVLSRPLPLPPNDELNLVTRKAFHSASGQLEARQDWTLSPNLFGRSSPATAQEIHEHSPNHGFGSLEPRAAKISKADQATRKAGATTQANIHGKANKPVSPTKKQAGINKQKAKQAEHKKNTRMPAPNQAVGNGPQKVTGADVVNALRASGGHQRAGTAASTKGGTPYPHTFNNDPNVASSGANKNLDYTGAGKNGRPLDMKGPGEEFPVIPGSVYGGGNPQGIRVVTQNGNFKGLVSHDPGKPKGDPSKGDLYRVPVPTPKPGKT